MASDSADQTPDDFMRERYEHMMMMHQDTRNRIFSFIDELEPDQLVSLQYMLSSFVGDHGPYGVMHLLGYVASQMRMRGVSSIEEMNIAAAAAPSSPSSEVPDVVASTMREYGVKAISDVVEGAAQTDPRVVCLGCGVVYPTLDDRMLRSPGIDGCSGCQQKSGHG